MTTIGGGVEVWVDRAADPCGREVVIFGPFGMTATDMIVLSVVFQHHGFDVVRVEMGSSPRRAGTSDYRLSTDAAVVRQVLADRPAATVVSISLASLPVTLALGCPIASLVMLTPVVDLRATLRRVTGEDAFALDRDRLARHRMEVLGIQLSGSMALDALEHDLVTGEQTCDRIAGAGFRAPVGIVSATGDPWVAPEEVDALAAAFEAGGAPVGRTGIEAHVHQLNRHPRAAYAMVNALVDEVLASVGLPADRPRLSFRTLLERTRDQRSAAVRPELAGDR